MKRSGPASPAGPEQQRQGLAVLWPGKAPDAQPSVWALVTALSAALPDWRIKLVTAPRHDLRPLTLLLEEARHQPVVVAAPLHPVLTQRIRDAAVEAGVDPAALHVVDPWLGSGGPQPAQAPSVLERSLRLLVAAAARAAAYRRTPPAALRLRPAALSEGVTRRGLLAALRPQYEVIPWIDPARCPSAGGCALCIDACPSGAIVPVQGRAVLRSETCTGCNRCAAACPAGAVVHPAATDEMLMAEITALLAPGVPKREAGQPENGADNPAAAPVIAYTCTGVLAALEGTTEGAAVRPEAVPPAAMSPPVVLPVAVPCAAAVHPYLLLRPLELGAGAVVLVTGCDHCRSGTVRGRLQDRVQFVNGWLALAGTGFGPVAQLETDSARPGDLAAALARFAVHLAGDARSPVGAGAAPAGAPLANRGVLEPVPMAPDPLPAFAALGALIRRHPGHGGLDGPGVPFGRVAVAANRCTLCGLCSAACPTAALRLETGAQGAAVALKLNPAACAGCEACVPACPDRAVTVTRGLDLDQCREDDVVLVAGGVEICRRCRQPYASSALTAQIRSRLERGSGGLSLAYLEYCPACRVAAMAGGSRGVKVLN